ncbi:SIT4 phosphatase-associated protein (macronuclear) [Tetrahymena thermophila SB210]|uniref:SIT4 phosphatase-associated protein n=1 Tax=Tetrahymena thermophila (strain SB210) TaxID=312017 RepID=Q23RZ9_TETTS|nr:SIT4 phosphatase-associated protein [Tetrahymena thermophila SB210]EAR99240.3 SIT4 phosphatase-associated protein [Tetrahymena thermophila SB210]|eukprot:XP_001019485.3 SIT4 phosphatase-associated protein [Tetrahymena thermophila SB210]
MFFGSFWHAFGYINNPSNLENILKQENLTVEQLLDTDNIVNEIKQSQSKFIDFLKKNSHITKQIIEYAINMPDQEGNDEKKLYKYPFISSEILGTQIKGLEEILFDNNNYNDNESQNDESDQEHGADNYDDGEKEKEKTSSPQKAEDEEEEEEEDDEENAENKEKRADAKSSEEDSSNQETADNAQDDDSEKKDSNASENSKKAAVENKNAEKKYTGKDLLNQLLQFINTDEQLNDTSAGYFLKAINNVLTSNGQFYNFISDKPEVLEQLIKHIRTKSIAEVVLKLITTVGTEKEEQFNEERKRLLTLLNAKFLSGESFERENISYIIHEIISTFIQGDNQYRINKCPASVQQIILEESFIETFFKVIVDENSDSSSVGYAASILGIMVTFYNSKQKQKGNVNSSHQSDEEDVVIEECSQNIAFPAEKLFSQYIPSLIKFISSKPEGAAHTTSYGAEIVPFGIGKLKVVDLISHVFKSENKELISQLAQSGCFKILLELMIEYPWNNLLHVLIEKIVNEGITITFNGSNDIVKNELFGTSFNLLEFIADKSEEETSRPGKLTREIRQGYIGFLTLFAKKIQENTSSETMKQIKEANEKWKKYIETKFKFITDRENQNLGGDNPKNKKEDEIDDPNKFEIDIQKIYEKFNNYFRSNKKDDTNENKDNNEQVNEDIQIQDKEDFNNRDSSDEEFNNSNSDEEHDFKKQPDEKKLQEEEVQSEYMGHQYWKLNPAHDVEKLMEDL